MDDRLDGDSAFRLLKDAVVKSRYADLLMTLSDYPGPADVISAVDNYQNAQRLDDLGDVLEFYVTEKMGLGFSNVAIVEEVLRDLVDLGD